MNGQSPSIPTLDYIDLCPLVLTIKFEADALGITQEVDNQSYTDLPRDTLGLKYAKVFDLMSAILGSLSRRLKSQLISRTKLANTYQVIGSVTSIIQKGAETDRSSLKLRAKKLTFLYYANLDKYFEAHDTIGLDMLNC